MPESSFADRSKACTCCLSEDNDNHPNPRIHLACAGQDIKKEEQRKKKISDEGEGLVSARLDLDLEIPTFQKQQASTHWQRYVIDQHVLVATI